MNHHRVIILSMLLFVVASFAFAASVKFTISSLAPNPFTPTSGQVCEIRFRIPVTASCRIRILDASQQPIRALADVPRITAGNYLTKWDGRTDSGDMAPAGAYQVLIDGNALSKGTTLRAVSRDITVKGAPLPPAGDFSITQITPNRFAPAVGDSVEIAYTLPVDAQYQISITRVAGSTVRTLLTESNTAGAHTVLWDGLDDAGDIVADGEYTVRIAGKATTGAPINPASDSVTAFTPPSFAILSITPKTFQPDSGSTTVTYSTPVDAVVTIQAQSPRGVTIRTLLSETTLTADTHTIEWDGRTDQGTVVANGVYTIVITGRSDAGERMLAAQAQVTAATPIVLAPELGQTIEGMGSANFNWLNSADTKFSIAFESPRTAMVTQILVQWRIANGYGAGTLGTFTFELRSNGPDNYPSDTVLAAAINITPTIDGYVVVPITAMLTARGKYHLVMYNTDTQPAMNWSSPNTLMTRIHDWTASGFDAAVCENGTWQPWCSIWNPFNTSGGNYVNGSHAPLLLTWDDDSVWGDPYWSSAVTSGPMKIYGKNRAGELIVWDKPNVKIRTIGISVMKVGAPKPLIFHLEQVGKGDLATGTIATAAQLNTTTPTWMYVTLPTPVTLVQGRTYRLWFESPKTTNAKNYYQQYPPYGRADDRWLETSWGGITSYYITGTGSSWSGQSTHDLSFSLQQ